MSKQNSAQPMKGSSPGATTTVAATATAAGAAAATKAASDVPAVSQDPHPTVAKNHKNGDPFKRTLTVPDMVIWGLICIDRKSVV